MSISNHVLVGSTIALAIRQPVYALPLAFMSHFVLDSIPHFGFRASGFKVAFRQRIFYLFEFFDLIGLIIILATINFSVILPLLGALCAIAPDFEWAVRYFFFERKDKEGPKRTKLTKFHQYIQWGERPWGAFVEIGVFIGVYLILKNFVLR